MRHDTKASPTGNKEQNQKHKQLPGMVCKSRIKASVHVSHVASTLEDPALQRHWGSCTQPLHCYTSTCTWYELANSMLDQSLQLQILRCYSVIPALANIHCSCRVEYPQAGARQWPSSSLGFSQARAAAPETGKMPWVYPLVVWVWGGGEDLGEEQATASNQVRKTRMLHK